MSKTNVTIVVALITGVCAIIASSIGVIPSFISDEKVEIISFDVNQNEIFIGDKVIAKWQVKGAKSLFIEVDGKRKKVSNTGDYVFYPKKNLAIQLIARNGNNEDTATRNILASPKPQPVSETEKGSGETSKGDAPMEPLDFLKEEKEVVGVYLKGKVKDINGKAVHGAKIQFEGEAVFSDNSGGFTLRTNETKEGRIFVNKEGYNSYDDFVFPPKNNILIILKNNK